MGNEAEKEPHIAALQLTQARQVRGCRVKWKYFQEPAMSESKALVPLQLFRRVEAERSKRFPGSGNKCIDKG